MPRPRFTWIYKTPEASASQTGYRIRVADGAADLAGGRNLAWDSGWVESGETANIPYAGKPLATGRTYRYTVELRTNAGRRVESDVRHFTTGLMGEDAAWRAMWIGGPSVERHTFWYRRELRLEKAPEKAVAFVASPNYHILSVNGGKIGDAVLNNAWTDCAKTVLYSTCDVGDCLAVGDNAPGLTIGNGWHNLRMSEDNVGGGENVFSEPIKIVDYLRPVAVHAVGDGSYGVDFGQNFAGWVRLTLRGAAGTTVTMKFAELEHADHSVNQANLRLAKATDVYILKGGGEEVYEPRFTYHGFRYMQVFGLDEKPVPEMFLGCVVRSAVEKIGSFDCDSEILNRLHRNIQWTEAGNLHGLPTDCPQRDERLGWLNDMTVRNECALYNFRLPQLYAKWMGDIKDAQGPVTGAITDTAPFKRYGLMGAGRTETGRRR